VAVVVAMAGAATIPAPNLTYFGRERANLMRPGVRSYAQEKFGRAFLPRPGRGERSEAAPCADPG